MSQIIGKVGMTPRGMYERTRAYERLDVVTYQGSSWVAIVDVPAQISPALGSDYWQLVARIGETGPQGPVGPQGNSAFDGTGVELVNNLTQGGQTAALSAEQGKILKQELTELESNVNLYPFSVDTTTDVFLSDGSISSISGWAKSSLISFTNKSRVYGNINGFNSGGIEIPNIVYLDSNGDYLGCIPAVNGPHDIDSNNSNIPANTAFIYIQGNTRYDVSAKKIYITSYYSTIPNTLGEVKKQLDELHKNQSETDERLKGLNLYPFYAGQFVTSDIYLSDGSLGSYQYWTKSFPIPIEDNVRIVGQLVGFKGNGIEIPSIVFLDSDKKFIGAIPAIRGEHYVDTNNESQAIPSNAAYFVIQCNTSDNYDECFVFAEKSLIALTEKVSDISEKVVWKTENLYPFGTSQRLTTDVYLSNGSFGNYSNWAKSEPIAISNKSRLIGKLYGFNKNGIEIPSIVFLNADKNFIGAIPAIDGEHYVDTNNESQAIPSNASYFVLQGNTSPLYDDIVKYLYAEMYFEDAFRYQTKEGLIEPPVPYDLLVPKIVYNVGNDISRDVQGFPRNYSACLYLDNMLPIGLTEEPNVRFSDGSILKSIPCYEPPMRQIQGIGGGWEKPLMNNGESKTETDVVLGINNEGHKQSFVIKNRSVLNSATANKKANILIIGDSVTFGQNAFFEGNPNKANYTLLLREFFKKDGLQNGSGFEFDTIGTISHSRQFEYGGNTYAINAFNEGYSGTTMQNIGLYKNPKFLDDAGVFSFQNWLNKYRTKDANGNQLYFNSQKGVTGIGGDFGYYENGEKSEYRIGTEVTDVTKVNVYEPTHVFLFHGSNAQIYKNEYDDFIAKVREVFPNAIIGLGVPHVAGTYYPKEFSNYTNCERWNPMLDFGYDRKHYITAQSLDAIASDNSYEQNKVYVVPTYFVNPAAKAIPAMAVSEPMADFINGGKIYEPKGQAPDVHVGGMAHAAYAYQLYAWIKWTLL